ncbi:MAG: DJ-1/PfpI family protein [Oligoflexales bacterium]
MNAFITFYPGCIEFEVLLAAELAGPTYPVRIATPDGKDHKSANGITYKADCSYSTASSNDIALLLVPGGDPSSVVDNEDLSRLVQTVHKQSKTIGAICAGPFVLAQAGILKGKKIAHGYEQEQLDYLHSKNYFHETHLTDDLLQIDGNIITAKPQAYVEFAIEIARASRAVSEDDRLQKLLQFYKGKKG